MTTPPSLDTEPGPTASRGPNRDADAVAGLAVLAASLAAIGLLRLPYDYYLLLRSVFCIACALAAYLGGIKRRIHWMLALAALVVLYNPVVPIHLGRGTKGWWLFINAVTCAALIVCSTLIRRWDAKRPSA